MRLTCFFSKFWENRFDFVNERLQVEIVAPEEDVRRSWVEKPKPINRLCGLYDDFVSRADVLIDDVMSFGIAPPAI